MLTFSEFSKMEWDALRKLPSAKHCLLDIYSDHTKELLHTLSIMPRQTFELPSKGKRQIIHFVERKISGSSLRIDWRVSSMFKNSVNENIPQLFYKIETLLIRPLLEKQYHELNHSIKIGTISEIAERINFDGQDIKQIEEAIYFGSMIRIYLHIGEITNKNLNTRKKSEKEFKEATKLASEQDEMFALFDYGVISSSAIPRKNKEGHQIADREPHPDNSDYTGQLESSSSLAVEGAQNQVICIFPTRTYARILKAAMKVNKVEELRLMSALKLRLVEILYWNMSIYKPRGVRKSRGSRIRIYHDSLSELFPMKDPVNLEKVRKELKEIHWY